MACYSVPDDQVTRMAHMVPLVQHHQDIQGELELSWEEAVVRLIDNNLQLQAINNQLNSANRQTKRIWIDLLPNVELRSSQFINDLDLGDILRASSIQHEVLLFIYLQRYLDLPSTLYRNRLQLTRYGIGARIAYKMQVQLLWNNAQNIVLQQQQLEDAYIQRDILLRHIAEHQLPSSLREDHLRELDKKMHQAKIELATQLGLPGWEVSVDPSTLPAWLDTAERHFNHTEDWQPDQDWLNMLALELVASDARMRGIALEYWPDISGFLNLPNTEIDQLDNIDFNTTTASWQINFRPLDIYRLTLTMEGYEEDHVLLAQQLEVRVVERMQQLRQAKRQMAELEQTIEELEQRLARASEPEYFTLIAPENWLAAAQAIEGWRQTLVSASALRNTIMIQVWFLTDSGDQMMPLWPDHKASRLLETITQDEE